MSQLTLKQLLAQLADENLIAADDILKIETAEPTAAPKRPWYIQTLIAFSAWLSALFLLGFFSIFIADYIASEEIVMLIIGITLMLPGLLMRGRVGGLFAEQMTLVLFIVGELLTIISLTLLFEQIGNDIVIGSLITMAVLSLTCLLYPNAVHRFLITFPIIGALSVLLYEWGWVNGVHLLIAAVAGATVYLWWQRPRWLSNRRTADLLAPITYALPINLFALLTPAFFEQEATDIQWWWITTLIMLGALIILTLRLFREQGSSASSTAAILALVGLVALTLPAWQIPGILAGLLVFLLGYWRGSPVLSGIATLYFLFSISYYYYTLDMTLLTKSLVLMGSGLLFLVGSAVARRLIPDA